MRYLKGEIIDGIASPPPELEDLLERPLVSFLATTRPDGTLQCNPMWYVFADGVIQLSHTATRQKSRNLKANPSVSLCIADPNNLFRYLEVRGEVTGSTPDPDAQFHRSIRARYGMENENVPDALERVVITVTPSYMGGREMQDPTAVD